MLKGFAIISMLMLHLFCRLDKLPYTPLLWIGDTPVVYYFGLFGDLCVAVFCFISGYAHYMQSSKTELHDRWRRLLRFMIVFWTIAVLFSIIGLVCGNAAIPNSVTEFVLNCLTVKNSYNGAWWYANIYILLIALEPLSCAFAQRCKPWLVLAATFAFYIIGYGIRFWSWGACELVILSWIITHIGLLGTSYFPYAIGMLFRKYQVISRLRAVLNRLHFQYIYIYIITAICFAAMIVLHGIVPTLFVAVFTAVASITLMCLCPLPRRLTDVLCYFGEHSTNIWLVHMFFYSTLFSGLVFAARYPVLVFALLLALSLASSYVINWLSRPILKLIK